MQVRRAGAADQVEAVQRGGVEGSAAGRTGGFQQAVVNRAGEGDGQMPLELEGSAEGALDRAGVAVQARWAVAGGDVECPLGLEHHGGPLRDAVHGP